MAPGAFVAAALATCDDSKIFATPVALECPALPRFGAVDWSAFSAELYHARSFVFSSGDALARTGLLTLLRVAMGSPVAAFACPSAIAATCQSLAEISSIETGGEDIRLAFVQLALAFLPINAHRSCSQWPIQGRELEAGFLTLAFSGIPKFAWLVRSVPTSKQHGAIVSVCAGAHDEGSIALTMENRKLHAQRHGYDFYVFDTKEMVSSLIAGINITAANLPAFWRVHAVRKVLESRTRYYSWILWLDCDVVITDPTRSVETFLPDDPASLVFTTDAFGVSPSAWLLKPTAWAYDFLESWLKAGTLWRLGSAPLGEREALRHVVLPHWSQWLKNAKGVHWDELRWQREVQLAAPGFMLAAQEVVPGDLPSKLKRAWQPGDFAWHDPSCHRVAFHDRDCERRRLRALHEYKQRLVDVSSST